MAVPVTAAKLVGVAALALALAAPAAFGGARRHRRPESAPRSACEQRRLRADARTPSR